MANSANVYAAVFDADHMESPVSPWVSKEANGPELPFARLVDAAVQLPQNGHWQRSTAFQYDGLPLCRTKTTVDVVIASGQFTGLHYLPIEFGPNFSATGEPLRNRLNAVLFYQEMVYVVDEPPALVKVAWSPAMETS